MRRRPVQLTKELQGDRIDTNTFVSQVRKLAVYQPILIGKLLHLCIFPSIHPYIYTSIYSSILLLVIELSNVHQTFIYYHLCLNIYLGLSIIIQFL